MLMKYDDQRADVDYMSKSGAMDLAAIVLAYWIGQGRDDVKIDISRNGYDGREQVWVVRSNLLRGLPREKDA